MKTIKPTLTTLLFLGSALCATAQGATSPFASPFDSPDWSKATSITDGGLVTGGSYDISQALHLYDAGNSVNYFRVDLTSAFAENIKYGIYIDQDNNANTGGSIAPAGAGINGIEFYFTSDYEGNEWDAVQGRWKTNDSFSEKEGKSWLGFQASTVNGKSTLEWRIAPTASGPWDIGTNFYWLAGAITDDGLYDKTSKVAATPLPGAAWLLGSGLLGLVAMRRRKESV